MLHTQTTYSGNILDSLKTLTTIEKCQGSRNPRQHQSSSLQVQ